MKQDNLSDELVLTFGKFKGQTIGYVRRWAPDWLKWACSEVKGFATGEYGTGKHTHLEHRRIIAKVITPAGEVKWLTE